MNRAANMAKTALRLRRNCAAKANSTEVGDAAVKPGTIHAFDYDKYCEFVKRFEQTLGDENEQ